MSFLEKEDEGKPSSVWDWVVGIGLVVVIGGFTGDQRLFMGFAQIWRGNIREEALRQQLLSDPHSPGQYRAYVPLVNNDAFQRAFDVKPGDKMYRAPNDRVRIW